MNTSPASSPVPPSLLSFVTVVVSTTIIVLLCSNQIAQGGTAKNNSSGVGWRHLTNMTITAYCGCHKCCGSWSVFKKTASGTTPTQGRTVAMSRSVPFGSVVVIPSLGIGVTNKPLYVEDRLALRYDRRIDVYMDSHRDALRFGKRTKVDVWVWIGK